MTASPSSPSLSPTVENYLKHLFNEQLITGTSLLPMGRLAQALGVTPGTATTMAKALAGSGLIHYAPRDGVRLTSAGRRHALQIVRRHRLIELFLVRTLGLDWSEVHDEAEELEHAVSDNVLGRIDEFLNHPQFDPHGDPIPSAAGGLADLALASLAECPLDQALRIARVTDQDGDFLQMVERSGLTPGTQITVTHRDSSAQTLTIKREGRSPVTIGTAPASKILVHSVGPSCAPPG